MTRIEPPPIPAHAHTLATTGCLDQLPTVMDLAQHALETLVPSTMTRYEFLTVVDEAITNVILHAYCDMDPGALVVAIWRAGPRVIVSVRHRGQPPDLRTIPAPDLTSDLEHRRVGGLGIYLMQRLMDEVHFISYEDGSSETRLIKRVAA